MDVRRATDTQTQEDHHYPTGKKSSAASILKKHVPSSPIVFQLTGRRWLLVGQTTHELCHQPVSDLSIGPGPTNDTSGSCIQSGLALLSASEQPMGDMTEHSCPGQWPSTTGFAQMANADHPWPEAGKHLRVNKDS
ncbi:hypothetical protein HYQ46_012022 [Verticillium longisporum]|nr:hypothetical protein HYQ46_012022 [Verticillium longisporum]